MTSNHTLRHQLLIGASISAMLLSSVAEAQSGRVSRGRGAGGDPTAAAARAAQDQAIRQTETNSATKRALDAFRRAAQTRTQMQDAQIQARIAAQSALNTVPNGLGRGGLQAAPEIEIDPSLWQGANGPSQSAGKDGRTNVTVDQTQQKSILTWDSFHVGRETDLTFNQQGADWVVLNRVRDASPSQIHGSINAKGTVLILNQNGVLFGGASSVNVRNLVASSANITDAAFLDRGIYSSLSGANYLPSFTGAGGAIRVEAGAQIKTHTPESVTAGGGYVLLMGTEVTNAGSITTPRGQTVLSAGDGFILRRGYGTEENKYSTTRGNEVRGLIGAGSTSGTVINSGVIEAAQGDITLGGRTIRQDGVMVATTGVNQRGTIHLLNSTSDAEGTVTLGAESLTIILPELDSKDTALNGQRDALIKESATANNARQTTITGGFDDRSTLADRLDQSRVEIVTGGNVTFKSGSQTSAQGGQVAVQANNGRITVEDSARIDVSGVQGIALDMESNSILVNVQGNEMRDSPANRENDGLRSTNVWIDTRDLILLPSGTGGYEGDRWYTGGGLLEVGGHLANMAHGIGEWTSVGGTITLAAKEVVAHRGAVFDISGGSLDYQAGYIRSTRVLGADGKLYDIGQAPAWMKMVAWGSAFVRKHDRWGPEYTQVWSHPLSAGRSVGRWSEGYSVGRDAGQLILSAPTVLFEGDILAQVINGERQTKARAYGINDGYKVAEHTRAQAGSLVLGRFDLALGNNSPFEVDVKIGDIADVTADLAAGDVLPEHRAGTAWFGAGRLNEAQLGGLRLETAGAIAIESDLTLADGGAFKMIAPTIDVAADVTARSGSVSATNYFTSHLGNGHTGALLDADGSSLIVLREGATLDLRGLWVNTALDAADTSKLGLVDGGNVTFASTHDVTLEEGSRIDVSSGAAMLDQNETRGGVGGNVSLIADLEVPQLTANGLLTLNGEIAGFGVNGGGTLKVESGTSISIGGEVLETDGVLKAGETSLVDLILVEDYEVNAGEALPVDYNYTVNIALPGEQIPSAGIRGIFTVESDWRPVKPENDRLWFYVEYINVEGLGEYTSGRFEMYAPGKITLIVSDGEHQIDYIPSGTILRSLRGMLAGWTVDPKLFPQGLPVAPYTKVVEAGNPAPESLTVSAGTLLQAGITTARPVVVKTNSRIGTNLFQSGFANYDISARNGVVVTEGTSLEATGPVYRFTVDAGNTPTGSETSPALALWTDQPLYLEDPVNGVLTQRPGASITLRSERRNATTMNVGAGGPIVIAADASVTVDPGQSITLLGRDLIVEGRLNAWGGTIALDVPTIFNGREFGSDSGLAADPGLIWIGDDAVIDVAARPALFTDRLGRSYGVVADGGVISIGGGLDWDETGEAFAPNAYVVIRPGALLDASGTSGALDVAGNGPGASSKPVTVASDGGMIIVKSNNSLYLDGTLRAEGGGNGAAGGTLALALEAPNYKSGNVNGNIINLREFIVAQEQGESSLSQDATALTVLSELTNGTARLGVDRVEAGGFDNLSLLVNGALSFDGDVALDLGQSLRLYAGAYGLAETTAPGAKVTLTAPFVRLAGATRLAKDGYVVPNLEATLGLLSEQAAGELFAVEADLIDIRDTVRFGARALAGGSGEIIDRGDFATVALSSTGDLRLLRGIWRENTSSPRETQLESSGNIVLTAVQIYPATDASARIVAGYQGSRSAFVEGTSLTIARHGEGDVAMPHSAFGELVLSAETINQGGVVRAPFGSLSFGSLSAFSTTSDSVNLLAGSITSVSGAGLTMPYGGSVDGIKYKYDGRELGLTVGSDPIGAIGGTISLQAAKVTTQSGSTLDLSGGGELIGAGFITGRGGSVDVLTTPFINANPGYGFSDQANAIYAIVPSSSTSSYAPVAADAGFGDPLIGQQITIPEGVPGLDAGTYTLMPSTYALQKGAFRVEIGAGDHAAIKGVTALGNGSYIAAGILSVANTSIREALPNQVIITPAETVTTHSSYNDLSYNEFLIADAARLGIPRTRITVDAGNLSIGLFKKDESHREALSIEGAVLLRPEKDSSGYGGAVAVTGISEVLAEGQTATPGLTGASVYADALNAFNAPRLLLNASISNVYGQSGRYATITGSGDLTIRSGAAITAGEIILGSNRRPEGSVWVDGLVTIEEGASLIARAGDARAYDSSDGYVFRTEGALIVSSGWINLLLSEPESAQLANTGGNIDIGACATDSCDLATTIVADGTIAVATSRALTLADNVSYGAKNLVLGVGSVNLGENASLDAARATGQLTDGLVLNQSTLAELLAGNTAIGAPALETLVLNARDSVNVYGAVELDATSLDRLVFGTPAIYGYGSQGDLATIRAGEFVWTGSDAVARGAIFGLPGDGALAIEATSILFGYGPDTQSASNAKDARLALGFANVSLNASERITASGESTLSVYQSRADYVAGEGWQYTGGDLFIAAPLVTGEAGSKFTVAAGGDVTIAAAEGAAADVTSDALGAQLTISGRNVTIDTAVVLPSGRLMLEAQGDLSLGDAARIDLSGRAVTFFDDEGATQYSWGGDLTFSSANGNISTMSGTTIDLSAEHNRGGTMKVTALGPDAGHVDLAGVILGSASAQRDAGGTVVPYDSAELTVRAQTLADFAGLNGRLNDGEVFGARRFQIKQGDLVVGDGVKASQVEIVLDGGDLTIDGKIDASGYQVGAIRLAAMGDLTVNGTLDAHGAGLRVDSYGKIIDSPNRAVIELTSREGRLALADGAVIDLRAGTDVAQGTGAGQNDGVARGTLDLNAIRVATNDVAIDVVGTPTIQGAKTIAVNAFRTYDDAPLAELPDVSGDRPQLITQAYLDAIDLDSQAFINAALGNDALAARLAGLGGHRLRPGVEIVSDVDINPSGTLTVAGDLDLSGYRYGPDANRDVAELRGFGEPGVLHIRAAGDLNIYGSINDGFAPPAATPDDAGWVLGEGTTPFGGDIVIPTDGVILDAGTTFVEGVTLNYDLPLTAMRLASGTMLPVDVTLSGTYSLAAGTVVAANIYHADGSVAHAAGTVLADPVTLTAGMKLGAGMTLNASTDVAALTWPKGVALPTSSTTNSDGLTVVTTSTPITLARGSFLPSMTNVQLADDASVDLRSTVEGRQGANWAVAGMLGEGATSWGLNLVAGGDLTSADVKALNPASSGMIRLADTHYGIEESGGGTLGGGVNAKGVDLIVEIAGGLPNGISDKSELIGKNEQEIIDLYYVFSWDDFGLPGFWEASSGNILTGLTEQGASTIWSYFGWPVEPGYTDADDLVGLTELDIVRIYGGSSWDDFGLPGFWDYGSGNSTVGVQPIVRNVVAPAFSVVRTGTGDLSLVAAGDIRMQSLYGVYTAGTASSVEAAYNQQRGTLSDGSVLGDQQADYSAAMASYQAWYPDQGGNLLISAGGNLTGDILENSSFTDVSSVVVGNWLWRQGSGSAAVDDEIPTAWWTNFGTYARIQQPGSSIGKPQVIGFTGYGTLGGGNVTVSVGGDAGTITPKGAGTSDMRPNNRSQGLVIAVGSTGRVSGNGVLDITGGGDIEMRIAGAFNPLINTSNRSYKTALSGSIVNLRGMTSLEATSIGSIQTTYRTGTLTNPVDPRGLDPFETSSANSYAGLALVPGDSTVYLQTLGDMVIAGVGDATRSLQLNTSGFTLDDAVHTGGGYSWFSLWSDHTAINLTSLGGNMAPSKAGSVYNGSDVSSDISDTWPAILRVAALEGNIYYGASAGYTTTEATSDMLAPSAHGELAILAAGSIYGGDAQSATWQASRHSVTLAATGTEVPTPFNPAFVGNDINTVSNLSVDGGAVGDGGSSGFWNGTRSMFSFGPNTAATASVRAADAEPVRIYAMAGDIVGLSTGETKTWLSYLGRSVPTWYSAGAPVRMQAGRDIVGSGTQRDANLIVHSNEADISIVSAGRDILYSNFDIAGPGTLEISAGRNILQEDQGSFTSIGPIVAGDNRPGAAIALMAGMANGVHWTGIRDLYLDPANLADPERPLGEQNGIDADGFVTDVKAGPKNYGKELGDWLDDRYGFTGTGEEALAYFDGLAPEHQRIFLRKVFYVESREGGREYNDADGPRFGSYLRGRLAIAALFPDHDADGNAIKRTGDIIMFGGSGVRTNFGGGIEMMAPGGRIVVGVQGEVPPASAGVVTQGAGDINMFSEQSILLGLSRILTTFGGSIFGWSAKGDINAGRGAKTTVLYTPPLRTYDNYGNVRLAPQVPSSGAGIGTLNPIPEVPAGDIDLVAPLGTIDAGEAGIRVSGNINLAALQVLNAANIQVQGEATGIPVAVSVNTGALTSASSAASAVANQAADLAERARPRVRTDIPSIITSRFLGFGE